MFTATVHHNAGAWDSGYWQQEIKDYFATKDTIGYFAKEGTSYWAGGIARKLGIEGKHVDPDLSKQFAKGFIDGQRVGKVISVEEAIKIQKEENALIAQEKMQPHQRVGIYQIEGDSKHMLMHRAATEGTLSAPKSVSILALVLEQKDVLEAHNKAVKSVEVFLEKEFSRTRLGKGGKEYAYGQKALFEVHQHYSSRANDPQLHNHVIMHNLALGEDGKYRTQSNEEVLRYQRLVGAFYRNSLANEMKALDYGIEARPDGMWEVKGMPQQVLDMFSKRSNEIEQLINKEKMINPMLSPIEVMEKIMSSRQEKSITDMDVLLKNWKQELNAVSIDLKAESLKKNTLFRQQPEVFFPAKFSAENDNKTPVSDKAPVPTAVKNTKNLSISDISAQLNYNVESFCQTYLSGGIKEGNHWRVGNIDGEKGKSTVVDLNGRGQGGWYDFSTGSRGDLLNILEHQTGSREQAIVVAKSFLGISKENIPFPPTAERKEIELKEQTKQQAIQEAKTLEKAKQLWQESVSIRGTMAEKYLQVRGIDIANMKDGETLRFHPNCYFEAGKSLPALVAKITDMAGTFKAITRIYLNEQSLQSGKAVAKKMLGKVSGNGVRFTGAQDKSHRIIIGEGVETMLSLKQQEAYRNDTVIATLSTSHMKNFDIAPSVSQVIIAADRDEKTQAGLKAAQYIGEQATNKQANVYIYLPKRGDFNDDLQRQGKVSLKGKLHSVYLGTSNSREAYFANMFKTQKGQVVCDTVEKFSQRYTVFDVRAMMTEALAKGAGREKANIRYEDMLYLFKNHPDLRFQVDERTGQPTFAVSRENHRTEQEIIQYEKAGRGQGKVIATTRDIKQITKQTFVETGQEVTKGQRDALKTIATSTNRFVYINGNPGAGKTYALGKLKQLLESKGYTIIGMTTSSNARDEMQKEGIKSAKTVAHFLSANRGYLKVRTEQENTINKHILLQKQKSYAKTVFLVDESSMIGNKNWRDIMKLCSIFNIPKVAYIGDTEQLLSPEAGKPFEMLIKRKGSWIARMTENIRSKSQAQREVIADLATGSVKQTIATLERHNMLKEIVSSEVLKQFAKYYAIQKNKDMDVVGIASRIEQRDNLNIAVRQYLNTLKGSNKRYTILQKHLLDTVDKSFANNYTPKQIIEFHAKYTGNKDGEKICIEKGDRFTIEKVNDDSKVLTLSRVDKDGNKNTIEFSPGSVKRRNILWDVYEKNTMNIKEGEEIRFTKNDKKNGVVNNGRYKVTGIDKQTGALEMMNHRTGEVRTFDKDNPVLQHIDYSYVVTTHCSQGMTCDRTVGYFDANDKMLTTKRNFTVMVSRAKDGGFFATTDTDKLQKTITAKREERTAIEAHRDGINKDLSDKRTMTEIVKQGNTVAHLDRETVRQTTEKNTGANVPAKQKSHSKNVEMEI